MEQVSQRGGRCPTSGNIQGQIGWDSEQSSLLEDVLVCCKGVWVRWPLKVQPKLFCDSMILYQHKPEQMGEACSVSHLRQARMSWDYNLVIFAAVRNYLGFLLIWK